MQVTQAKGYKGMGMNGVIAKWYASNTRHFMDDFTALAKRVAGISPGPDVLEVAPGPGYFAIELAKLGGFSVAALDISKTFVEIATKNAIEAGVEVNFQHGDVAAMPFPSHSFDFILCRAAFKNFAAPVRALQEMERVLRVGGKALIIDLRRDAPLTAINQVVDRMGGNSVNRALNQLTFRFVLLKRAYTRADFEGFLSETRFREVEITAAEIGFEITLTK
ncbi:MAG: class I SAM-dependent methyltransferase [Acidobacteriia bacterium]|nr:class I SAM-dependent methyltransferase [Terriglobia bacterium]